MKAKIYLLDSESSNDRKIVAIIRPKREFTSVKEARAWMHEELVPSMGLVPNTKVKKHSQIALGRKYPSVTKGALQIPLWTMKIFCK